jgi:hypothetical protein
MRVRIYRPAKSASQSGRAKTYEWRVEPEILTPRAPEPVMGWASAADTLGELSNRMSFPMKEDAIAFAVRNGWDYFLEEPAERRIRPRNYLDNFRSTRPQDEEKRPVSNSQTQ